MHDKETHEALVAELNNPETRTAYEDAIAGYRTSLLPRILGGLLVLAGNLVYGTKPSYMKFRAVEVIARVPYQSWVAAAYTLFTLFYSDERKALKLSGVSHFSRIAQDNETMHVVVISKLACEERRPNVLVHTLIPMLFAFGYYWASYLLFMINRRYSYELNYHFESHAYAQYERFLQENEEALKHKPVSSDFLVWYGRTPRSQYEFFESVRNDELIHRNASLGEIRSYLKA